jgi:hypothetical protein
MKAQRAIDAQKLTDIPNVGKAMAHDFMQLGVASPGDLKGRDPFMLYKKMCMLSGGRQDPCVLDTYMAAIDFMNGAAAKPWWAYTTKRKKEFPDL